MEDALAMAAPSSAPHSAADPAPSSLSSHAIKPIACNLR